MAWYQALALGISFAGGVAISFYCWVKKYHFSSISFLALGAGSLALFMSRLH